MAAWLHTLQNSAFSAWVVGSDSIWAYPMILTMHTVGLGIVVGAAVIVDLRLLGVAPASRSTKSNACSQSSGSGSS